MWTLKEVVIFLSGAQTFHTFSHFFMYYVGFPPFQYYSWTITPQFIFWTGALNIVITLALFWWLMKLR